MRQAVPKVVFGSLHTKLSVSSRRANMQWSLLVLILMAQCSLCMCCLYKYHFVQQNKSWEDARKYCREHYTDLATVWDASDMVMLVALAGNQSDAWIGLRNEGVSKRWHWSLPGLEFNASETEWHEEEPNNAGKGENCVVMRQKHKWVDYPCTYRLRFICYDEKKDKTFHLINEGKTWQEAQSYCREKHTDLVSGLTQLHDEAFRKEIKNENDVWIGGFADTWRWSDGSNFRHWDPKLYEGEVNKKCATVSGRTWSSDKCNKEKTFFCYKDEVILINKSMTWENALTYCRENHRELVSITNAQQQRWVQERAKKADTTHVWIGLRYSCTLDFWFWITDEVVDYKNWKPNPETDDCDMSGAMETGGQHQWSKENANMKFNFICFKR